jgi:hypothetical protein
VIAEDNEIRSARGAGMRLTGCRRAHAHGNEVHGAGSAEPSTARGAGLLVEGDGSRCVRITDNRVTGASGAGILVTGGRGLRVVGNEIHDGDEGLRVCGGSAVVVVGNDCRGNASGGIRLDDAVRRGLVALNHAVSNGLADLVVSSPAVRRRANKVDHEASAA